MISLKQLTSPFVEFGPGAGLIYAIDRTLGRLSPRLRLIYYEFLAQPIVDRPLVPVRHLRNREMREVRRGDAELELMPAREDIKRARFDQGAFCLAAHSKGDFTGYIWFRKSLYEEDEVRCTFVLTPGDRSVFDFDLYVFPKYRMGMTFASIWHGANEHLRELGIDWSFSRVSRFNLESRRAHARLGARRVGRSLIAKCGRFELFVGSVRPYASVRWTGRIQVHLGAPGIRAEPAGSRQHLDE